MHFNIYLMHLTEKLFKNTIHGVIKRMKQINLISYC